MLVTLGALTTLGFPISQEAITTTTTVKVIMASSMTTAEATLDGVAVAVAASTAAAMDAEGISSLARPTGLIKSKVGFHTSSSRSMVLEGSSPSRTMALKARTRKLMNMAATFLKAPRGTLKARKTQMQ